jgi:hypothetical protein
MAADYNIPRCQIIPEPEDQAVFQIGDQEVLRWHHGKEYPRPFFYPLNGPSGQSLTRMGHPGAANHDHHRSVWFAHNKVLGMDFWADGKEMQIRQHGWLVYQDGEEEAVMASEIGWYDGHDPQPLLKQVLVAALQPDREGQYQLELQATFTPTAETLELQKTNFGMLAVRVSKNLSVHFGGGTLANSEGQVGEPAIFGKPARWMDYSGPVSTSGPPVIEGISYIDHPKNPGQPTHWHVREDGWMGASLCFNAPIILQKAAPLRIRYLLDIHSGPLDAKRANRLHTAFSARLPWKVFKGGKRHHQYTVMRVDE